MTIDALIRRCRNNINLAAWACDVSERQIRNYMKNQHLPPQRAALAETKLAVHENALNEYDEKIRAEHCGT